MLSPDDRAKWAGWQKTHVQAPEALQAAETTYHRLSAAQAFMPDSDLSRTERRHALQQLDESRTRLDEIREQQPPWPH